MHINTIAHSASSSRILIGGPDGYCAILSTSPDARPEDKLELKGHVGDVLDVRWFPSDEVCYAALDHADAGKVVLTASSDLSIRVFSAKDGVNPRILRGHTRAITSLSIIGVGRQVLSAGKDGTIRLWDVGSGRETKKWEVEKRRAIEGLIVIDDPIGKAALRGVGEERVIIAACQSGHLWILPWSGPGLSVEPVVQSNLVCIAYSQELGVLATGHTNGVIAIRSLQSVLDQDGPNLRFVRRNESPIYSLVFTGMDLLLGTAAGLPCRLSVRQAGEGVEVWVKEEYAGWEAVGVESWSVSRDGVWCAGGEGGVRRY